MSIPRVSERRDAIGVQSIEVGLKLLRPLIDAGKPLNLKVIADSVGFAAPKAHRYLVSLINAGLIEQDVETGRYGFGVLAFELGLNALGLLDRDKIARTTLTELEFETGRSACLLVWGNKGPTVFAVESSPQSGAVFVAMRVGSTLSLLLSASGRVFLSFLPKETTNFILSRERRKLSKSDAEIDRLITRVRRQGYGISKDAAVAGISAISAPIFDHSGRLIYALSLFGPTGSLDTSPTSKALRCLQLRAHALSARIGYREEGGGKRP